MRAAVLAAPFVALLVGAAAPPPQEPLVLIRSIRLPQVDGRIDHMALDVDAGRLFVAALGNNTLEVIDTNNGVHLQSVKGLHEPQGIAVARSSKRIVVANGEGGQVDFRDAGDLHVTTAVALSDDADNVRYDGESKRVFVGYGSGALAILSEADGRRLGDVRLAAHPESFQLEGDGPRIFVNVPNARQIAVVDRNAMRVVATWPVTAAAANFPMAVDERSHRLFVGCRRPARVLIIDTTTGSTVGSIETVGDTDDLFFDAKRRRLYVSGGEGSVDVLQQADANHLMPLGRIATASGARTSLYSPDQDRLYVAVPHRGSQAAEIRVYQPRD